MMELRIRGVGIVCAGLALAVGVAGCVTEQAPAPVVYGVPRSAPPPEPAPPRAVETDIVNPVPPRAVVQTAPLPPPVEVSSAQKADDRSSDADPSKPREQRVAGAVIVAKGDTLYSISKRYFVALRDLIDANNLKPPYVLSVGQRIIIPGIDTHTVAKGDTAYSISRLYDVDVTSLLKTNHIGAPYTLLVGQRLALPPKVYGGNEEGEPGAQADPKVKAVIGTPPARTGKGFAWPVRGKIVSRFGTKPDGLHNDGINIAVDKGAPVRAADNGVVVYAGSALKGYGKLILVRHAGGWITAYAHNDQILVDRGQVVRSGQIIARAGTTGSVSTPQLHFEIRKGANAVDPQQFLT
jgi:murein DD-endopeptidase MepM/ murein hydrolase activator NlpD